MSTDPDARQTQPGWPQVDELLQEVLELSAGEQQRRLEEIGREHPQLRRELEDLLESDRQADRFLEEPAGAWVEGEAAGREFRGLREGDRLGAYRIVRRLGRGGMSTVYLAVRADDQYQQQVALKIAHTGGDSQELMARFLQERQILADLEHPGIARLLDGGATPEGLPYLVLEYVEGLPITDYADRQRLGVAERLSLLLEVCDAVRFAHHSLVVHRDLKPSNILVTAEGRVKLLDFGIAKLLHPGGSIRPSDGTTRTWLRILTPRYASPEQIRGEAVTTASDVYSLGVLLYELLTGRLPHRLPEGSLLEVERVLLEEEPRRPSQAVLEEGGEADPRQLARLRRTSPEALSRSLRGDLDAIVRKALSVEVRERYGSVQELVEDLHRHRSALPVAARRGTLRYRGWKFLRRHRLGLAAAGVLLLLGAGLLAQSLWHGRRIAAERDLARAQRDLAEQERQRAEEVSKFLVELFEVSDPEVSRGRIPDTRELLDRGAARISRELRDQPVQRATLLRTLGAVYRSLGLWGEAEPFLAEALAAHRQGLGPGHREIVRSLLELAYLRQSTGDFDGAESLLREALAMTETLFGPESPQVATGRHQLASVLLDRGDLAAAEPLFRQALELRERLLEPDHLEVAESLGGLAELLRLSGRTAQAVPLYRRALVIYESREGEDHPRLPILLNDLALALGRQGQRGEAEALLREAVSRGTRVLGPEHPQVVTYLANLAGMLITQGKSVEGETAARQALELRSRIPGAPLGLCSSQLAVGHAVHQQGRLGEAEAFYRQALETCRAGLGENHPHSAHPLLWLGRVALDRGEPAAAAPHLRQALTIWRAALPPDHVFIARAEGGLAASELLGEPVARESGSASDAEAVLRRSFETVEAQEGLDAGFSRWLLRQLIAVQERQGNAAEAQRYRGLLATAQAGLRR